MKIMNMVKLGVIGIVGMMFIGCGSTIYILGRIPKSDTLTQKISFSSPKMALFQAEAKNNANTFALQVAADMTIKNGYNYFAFKLPKGAISNAYGSLINTPADYLKTCNSNSTGKDLAASAATLGLFHVSIKDNCHIGNIAGNGFFVVISYKKQPLNITSYDARAVIKYYKEKKLYIPVPDSEIESKIVSE